MISEHLSTLHIERYNQRKMSATELANADDHLAKCDMCRQKLSEVEQLDMAFEALRSDLTQGAAFEIDHMDYDKLVAYVDNKCDSVDNEIIESHLQVCSRCAME